MSESVKHLSESDFISEVEGGKAVYLVDFWAPWCGPCHMIAPILEELASEMSGKLKVAKVNVDENGAIAQKYGIMSIPTLMLFKEGKVQGQLIGAVPKQHIKDFISKHL